MSTDAAGPAPAPDAIHFFTRPGCPFSAYLSHRLRRLGLPLEYHDIWVDRDAAAFVRSVAGGDETVPTVVVGDVTLVAPRVRQVVAVTTDRAPHLLPDRGSADELPTPERPPARRSVREVIAPRRGSRVGPSRRGPVAAAGRRLPPVELCRAEGEAIELGAFLERSLLVVAIRYYG